MADNVVITPGTGNTVAADEVTDATLGTVKVQYTKLMDGTIDSTNKAVVDAAGDLQVDVNNFPATQTVSGTVAVSNFPATQTISGTVTANAGTGNFTVTQATGTNLHTVVDSGSVTLTGSPAISGTVTANQGTANTFTRPWPVALSDGTIQQGSASNPLRIDPTGTTSQPVTLTSTTITGNTTVVQPTGTNLHTVVDSGTLTAVTSITNALPAGTNVIGHVIADSGSTTAVTGNVTVVQGTGTNLHTVLDSGTVTSITNAVTVSQATAANLNATVTQQTLTKGTQGATGVSTQDLKDAGRNYVTFTANAVAGVTAEALFSFNQTKQGTATASVTSYTVTSGKTLRITGMYLSNQDGTTTAAFGRAILRHNTAGATTTSSPVVAIIQAGGSAALAGSTGYSSAAFPDGIEIYGNGTQSIGVSHLDQATTNVVCCTLVGYEY